jgi:hypothetical protein
MHKALLATFVLLTVFMIMSALAKAFTNVEPFFETDEGYLDTTGVEDPELTGVEDPYLTGVEDPELTGVEDPYFTGEGDPELTGIEDPELTGVEDPYFTGVEDPEYTEELPEVEGLEAECTELCARLGEDMLVTEKSEPDAWEECVPKCMNQVHGMGAME